MASWNYGVAKQADTFDQDSPGVEHPVYTQAMFALERLHTLAPQHSDWRKKALSDGAELSPLTPVSQLALAGDHSLKTLTLKELTI